MSVLEEPVDQHRKVGGMCTAGGSVGRSASVVTPLSTRAKSYPTTPANSPSVSAVTHHEAGRAELCPHEFGNRMVGFARDLGLSPVAVATAATSAPLPGTRRSAIGKVESVLVAMKRAPSAMACMARVIMS